MKQHIIDFLEFLESKENRKAPIEAKLIHPDKFSPITKEDLYIEGDLNLQDTDIKSLPDNLTIGGHLDMYGSNLESIPNNLKVKGTIFLWGTPLADEDDGMTEDEIEQEIIRKGGYVKGSIQI